MRKIVFITCFQFFLQYAWAQAPNKDVELIKSLRQSSNEAIANHDIDKLSSFWLPDLVLVRGNSTHANGKDNIISDWKKLFTETPKVLYIRTPSEIIISSNDSLAWETGTWKAFNSYSAGGNYSAMWKRSNETWKILAELFVSLH